MQRVIETQRYRAEVKKIGLGFEDGAFAQVGLLQ